MRRPRGHHLRDVRLHRRGRPHGAGCGPQPHRSPRPARSHRRSSPNRANARILRSGQPSRRTYRHRPLQQAAGRDWLVILLMVITAMIGVLQMVQNAEHQAEDEQKAHHPTPTTLVITDRQANQITQTVEHDLLKQHDRPSTGGARARTKAAHKRKPRPPKQYGKNKRNRSH